AGLPLAGAEQLQRLEDALRRSLPASLPVLGAVMTVARGNPAAHQVLVDSWPDFACRPHPPAPRGAPLGREIGEKGPGQGGPGERGMQDGVHEAVNEVAAAKGLRVKVYRYRADAEIPAGLRLAPLSPSHVPLLNATWSFGGTGRSRRFLEGLVRALPSACILDPRRAPALLEPGGPPGLPEPRLHRAHAPRRPAPPPVHWPRPLCVGPAPCALAPPTRL
uniref:Glycine N-acyltransferase-like protein n=1 Tax=Anas platyrhynchos TaxID=8839 RepID=A0A8B9QRM9_ANAPL